MPDPIVQQIKVDYDGRGVEEAAGDLGKVGEANERASGLTKKAARETESYAQQLDRLQGELRDVATNEDRYTASLQRGEQETEASSDASRERRAEMERLSREIA